MYCVRCGVELGESEKRCPLCGTVVFHPEMEPPKGDGPYPPEEHTHKEVSRSGALFVVTVLTVLPIVICLLCDWRISGGVVWSGYVAGALLMAYVVIVLPLWFRHGNPVIFVPVDFVALGVYLLYINLATGGHWFLSFAFPVVGAVGLLVTAMVTLLRYLPGGHLYVFGGGFILMGGVSVLVEFLINLTFGTHDVLLWSIYPLAAGVIFGVTLIIIACCRPLRESLQKKFFL